MPSSTPEARFAGAEDYAHCTALLAQGSKTFYRASRVLPARVQRAATALYAFCRVADEAIDVGNGGAEPLASLHVRLDRVYAGRPGDSPVDRALADAVSAHAIPRELWTALLEGFAWDASGRSYESIDELIEYAARVAGTVGAMMTVLMGRRERDVVARACDLGVAMQLTNIARDVADDAALGRLYLPRAWLREAGIDPESFLHRPAASRSLVGVIERLLATARDLYERAVPGIGALPAACRPSIHAARLLYSTIGDEVRRLGPAVLDRRAVVPSHRKTWLLACALLAACAIPVRKRLAEPPLSATVFLIDAVARSTAASSRASADVAGPAARLIATIELFERLQRRQVEHALAATRALR
jgi:phytoene synthase